MASRLKSGPCPRHTAMTMPRNPYLTTSVSPLPAISKGVMVKLFLKGGAWRNVEDEILKAAVMKYGKNSWARVASLLSSKNPKQAKARWYEWLDPSIKKTEWTREEDEKLLHLAKLYPSQYRTIAPLVGRTAGQCMERYERLLDEASKGEVEDARRLRPGEIDPAPESRPARPDPVDMDEDEKEMLSEARARLANTRGKKAKRKAREAMMDEARRLASLQKRRELKAAGIYTASFEKRKRAHREVDYGGEIPFRREAPPGFYDTSEEKLRDETRKKDQHDKDFEAIRIDKFEAERRDAAEARARRDDQRKRAKLMEKNLPLAVEQLNRLNDPSSRLRRSKLELPAPQVTDEELEALARQNDAVVTGDVTDDLVDASGAVEKLLRDSRAARTPFQPDTTVAQEARNALRDRTLQTPLLGEDQIDRERGTGYAASLPPPKTPATPHSLVSRASVPPGRSSGALGLNDDDEDEVASTMPTVPTADELRKGLAALPAPKYAYDVEEPPATRDDDDEEAPAQVVVVEDAADRDARVARAAREDEEARLARRSSAVKRDLPRPRALAALLEYDDVPSTLIRQEMSKLLVRDAFEYPVKGQKPPPGDPPVLDTFDDDELRKARDLVADEASSLPPIDDEAFERTWRARFDDVLFFPDGAGGGTWGTISAAPSRAAIDAGFRADFETTRAQMTKGATRAARIEDRVEPKVAAHVAKAQQLTETIAKLASRLDQAALEAVCFERLHRLEQVALPKRLAAAKAAVAEAHAREARLQAEYAGLQRDVADDIPVSS